MSFPSITNRGEFFSNHYLDSIIGGDLGDLRSRWSAEEAVGESARSRLRAAAAPYFAARAALVDSGDTSRAADDMNRVVLTALGYAIEPAEVEFTRNTVDRLVVPATQVLGAGTSAQVVVLEADVATDPVQLFGDGGEAVELLRPLFRTADKKSIHQVGDAVSELFATDDPPRFIIVAAGRLVLLAARDRWAEGRFLAVDIDAALERNDTAARGELETITALFSTDALVPPPESAEADGAGTGQPLLDRFVERSHQHAVGVSKELRRGIRDSVEILANEVIERRRAAKLAVFSDATGTEANELTRQCLRYLYRLIVLLYAESRPELGIVPTDDAAYMEGYSLDRLRELVLVDLDTDHARRGTHFNDSLNELFVLVNEGNHASNVRQLDTLSADATQSTEVYLTFPGLDAALFEPQAVSYLSSVKLSNAALQQVLHKLMVADGAKAGEQAGYISYAQLGINQLGAVYEGLMAYTGFFAKEDLYEVAKGGDPSDGTWMVPVGEADAYPDSAFVATTDPATGAAHRVVHRKGSFVFRLSGRDRQRSASYYTPEVLTRSVVRHALAELVGTDDYAAPGGEAGIGPGEARRLLDLTICEPALGSGAFANEAINQLSAEYLRRRQNELGEVLDPERYLHELQRVKAHFALNQVYGVDLNPTAVELAEVSMWLNAMYPGLKAPWFGLQLRAGNSLIGCRRATWRADQLGDRPWAATATGKVRPPVERPLSGEPLGAAEVHHFLLPGHGWASVATRKEAKELAPEAAERLNAWRKRLLAAPGPADATRLATLAAAVERCWAAADESIASTQRWLRRPIPVYGTETPTDTPEISRARAQQRVDDTDSRLGRLRALMDAWVGLWFWPLDAETTPPSWAEWLNVAEALVRPTDDDRVGAVTPEGELPLDFGEATRRDEAWAKMATPVADLRREHRWLDVALTAATAIGPFHWELEFAPVFRRGGFDLQVGNPPWVRPRWYEDLVLAEHDPWWGVADKPSQAERTARRSEDLARPEVRRDYLDELTRSNATMTILGSPVEHAVLAGVQTNLYMVFMETVWRHLGPTGVAGLLHPESHFVDPNAGPLRARAYRHLRRHWQFQNELFLFEDIHHMNIYGIHVYGAPSGNPFLQVAYAMHPDVVDGSLAHDGTGPAPGIQHPQGGWDLRPHRDRILTVDEEVLDGWARLFDEPGTPASQARLLRPVTVADLGALASLAEAPTRLADLPYHWTRGHEEDRAKKERIIRWDNDIADSWDEVVLQGPHFTVATPFAKQPNEHCAHNQDYSQWDLERLPERVIPRTNYQRACDRDTYDANLAVWHDQPSTDRWRMVWRRMTQPGLERSLQSAIVPPGPTHVNTVFSMAMESDAQTAVIAGLWSSLPADYLVKVSGKADVQDQVVYRSPAPVDHSAVQPLTLRTMRLNCLTADYAPLWEELFDDRWIDDEWVAVDPGSVGLDRVLLGAVDAEWTMATPLRRDLDRRMALVEIDALSAVMLGLTAEQLCAMYRTQFAVLRKYEHAMAFDAKGRKICAHHQSAGYRQAQLQQQAKDGELPRDWTNLWKLYERYEDDPNSVDWRGEYTPPFYRPDREREMTRAHQAFTQRLADGRYDR